MLQSQLELAVVKRQEMESSSRATEAMVHDITQQLLDEQTKHVARQDEATAPFVANPPATASRSVLSLNPTQLNSTSHHQWASKGGLVR